MVTLVAMTADSLAAGERAPIFAISAAHVFWFL
jgi:hypothetical protein